MEEYILEVKKAKEKALEKDGQTSSSRFGPRPAIAIIPVIGTDQQFTFMWSSCSLPDTAQHQFCSCHKSNNATTHVDALLVAFTAVVRQKI